MTSKKLSKAKLRAPTIPLGTQEKGPHVCEVPQTPGLTREEILADIAVTGVLAAGATIRSYSVQTFGEMDLTRATHKLQEQIAASKRGDLGISDELLVSQAATLNTIFHECCRRSALNMGTHLDATDMYMRIALRAQNQCRTTLETLANIKNPPVVFAKQANIAHGHQQVNNGQASTVARARNKNTQNKLLEIAHAKVERLDPGASGEARKGNTHLGTLEPIHGAAIKGRQGRGRA